MQLVKCELLCTSKDNTIQELYKTREAINAKLTRVWKASKLSTSVNAEVELNLKFPTQDGNQGIGFGNFDPKPSASKRRHLVTSKAATIIEESHVIHALSLKQQSVWLQWTETAEPFDLSWKNIIWGGLSPAVLKFILNASVNWVRTPDLMHLWGYKKTCYCCLCGADKCTLHHILSGCNYSLKNNRFTWRHNSVLSLISQRLKEHIASINSLKPSTNKTHFTCFVKAGASNSQIQKTKNHTLSNLLCDGNDWKILVDLPDTNYVFPPEIYSTNERPDICIWSEKLKRLFLIELTCPAEEGIEAAKVRKHSRYLPLIENISVTSSWKVTLMTLEVGVRGFVARSTHDVFFKLGLPRQQVSALCNELSATSAKCSYAIYLAANSKIWDQNRPLLASESP